MDSQRILTWAGILVSSRKAVSHSCTAGALAVALMWPTLAAGQTLPGSVRPPAGTFERENRAADLPLSTPRTPFTIDRPRTDPSAVDDSAKVRVNRFRIIGFDAISEDRLQAPLAPFLGQELTLADIYRAADLLTRVYAEAGYALSFALVPAQDVADGVVVLQVVEGSVDAIEIQLKSGAGLVGQTRLTDMIRRRFTPLIKRGPVMVDELERAILTSGDLGGMDVSVVVRPSETTPGAANLLVVVDLDPVVLEAQFDNRIRDNLGERRYRAGITANSLLVPGDQLLLDARATLPTDGFISGFAQYSAPITDDGLTGTLSYSRARSRAVRGFLSILQFEGEEEVFRAGLSYPLRRTRNSSLIVGLEGTAINSDSGIFGITLIDDRSRFYELYGSYDWAGTDGTTGLVRLGLSQGIDGLGATGRFNPLRSRTQGDPEFTAATASLVWNAPLVGTARVRVTAEAQMALHGGAAASRECNYGGDRFGRAYDYGAAGGDHCVNVAMELNDRLTLGPVTVQPFVFVDAGILRQRGRLDFAELRVTELWSAGGGARIALPYGLFGEVYSAWPGKSRFTPDGSSDPRIFFSIGATR
ncbi:POTRA domain, ShlB-type family protein [Blastomonas sp. RAC04]|uniref:ShlB/FhaC/HecB family hemolysin secretion/activation protein n=1 Tax=unclassified Blastomonas TaxID=2626550 RepID=UPI00083D3ED6|nr:MULTISPECIES: POTRA domain-containing protein [unclassified Blastomonas]AOG00175.1 POTRA domain, ShlB-type family protein [Blastomonas sp. RAC04]